MHCWERGSSSEAGENRFDEIAGWNERDRPTQARQGSAPPHVIPGEQTLTHLHTTASGQRAIQQGEDAPWPQSDGMTQPETEALRRKSYPFGMRAAAGNGNPVSAQKVGKGKR